MTTRRLARSLLSPISAGDSYQGLSVSLIQDKFGTQSETIAFDPVDTNASGYSAPLSPITLTITDTLELPGMIYSQAFGDVHIITYNGLTYDFQATGDFVLAQSRIPGDNFEIQMQLAPWYQGASVTTIQEVAIALGSDDVTFAWNRADTVLVDGVATTLSMADPTLTLSGGTITEVSSSVYKVSWNTGETMTVSNVTPFYPGFPAFISITDGVLGNAGPGAYAGLQGEDEGTQNDIQLADGQVLAQPVSTAALYGEYANSWAVSSATSLFNTALLPTTAPSDLITLAELPQNLVNEAAALVAAAGITDPGLAQAAELDYLATGDPSFISAAANMQQEVVSTTTATETSSTTPATAVGVSANATSVTEAANGDTAVTFTVYLTAAETTDNEVDYAVLFPGAGYLGASAFGGTLPSGSVTIAAGQTTAQFTINVPQGALGTDPSDILQVQVSDPDSVPIFAPTAQTEVVNNEPEPGNLAVPELAYLGNVGTFTFDATTNTYTLDLGGLTQGQSLVAAEFAVVNAATAPSDDLGGTFTPPVGTGFIVTGDNLPSPLGAGQVYQGLYTSINTADLGSNTMSLTFDPTDVNDSGYSADLTPITLDIVDSVTPPAVPQVNTPTTIIFPNVHVGTVDSQHVSVTNTAAAGAGSLDVSLTPSGNATATGTITGLAPGTTDASDLSVGIDTGTAGALSGSVTESFVSDPNGNDTPISEQDPYIDLFGSAYRLADPSVIPSNITVHVGASGTQTITITNIDPNDGYSENLIATVVGTTGAVTASGTTGDIAPQADGTLAVTFSTTTAGPIGTVTLDLKSDGTGIDGLGVTDLGDVTIPVAVTSDNVPAAAQFEEVSGGGTFTHNGSAYAIDLGTITGPVTLDLGVLNSATVPADDLGGTFTTSGPSEFTVSGFGAFSGIASGSADTAPMVTLFTGVVGTFTETITLDPTDTTADTTLPEETLTIDGTVATATPPVITAPNSIAVQQGVLFALSGISGVSITDSDIGATVTATLIDNAGLLAADTNATGGGGTITGSGTVLLMIVGTLAQVNADLGTLSDTDSTLAADTITIDASDSIGATATPATIAVSVNVPLVITAPPSVLVQQSLSSAVAGVSVADADAGATITVTLGDTNGLLSANTGATGGGGTITGTDTTALTIVGTLAQVKADLTTLTDTDGNLSADTITINASDSAGATATPASIAVSVNAPPVITAPPSALVQQSLSTAVTGVSIADADAVSAGEAITVTLADTNGLLSANTGATGGGGTITGDGTTSLTIVGSLTQVNADLSTLADTDSSLTADSIAVNASDSRGGIAVQRTIAVSVNAPPVITAPPSALVQQSLSTAVTGVSIADADAVSAGEAIMVTLADTNGLLSANTGATGGGGTITGGGTTSLTIVGSLTQVNADLSTLADTDSSLTADSISVNASDSRGGIAVEKSITLDINAPPVVTVQSPALVQQSLSTAVADVSIADADAVSAGETITAILVDTNGLLSANTGATGGGGTITGSGTTSLTIVGSLTQVNADLSTLADTDSSLTADSIAVNASDSRGGTAVQRTIAVSVNAPPAITAPPSVSVDENVGSPVAGVSIADPDAVSAGETLTVTLADTDGLLSANTGALGGGGTITGGGTTSLTIVGTLAQVNADLSTLADTDSSLADDSVAINANDGRGGVAGTKTIDVSVGAEEASATIGLVNGNDTINSSYSYYPALGPYQIVPTVVTIPGGSVTSVSLSGDVSGFSAGDTFPVTVTDGYFAETYTATVGSSGNSWAATMPASDVAQLPDGTATFTAHDDNGALLATQNVLVEGSAAAAANGNLTISAGAELELFGAYSATATFASTVAGSLKLDSSTQFHGTIAGFGRQDEIDLSDIVFASSPTLGFTENNAGTAGTLTVSDGTHTANLTLLGNYMAASFAKASDGHGGTLVLDPPLSSAQNSGLSQPVHH